MPTITQLPGTVQAVSGADIIVLSQTETGGSTPGATAVVQAPVSALLALVPNQGAATTVPALPSGTTPTTADSVVMVQGGTADLVPYGIMIDGETINQLASAGAASDTDTFATGQAGSSTLTSQTLSAVNTYIQGKLPSYKMPIYPEVTSGTLTLDGTINGKLFVISGAGVTINVGLGVNSSSTSAFGCTVVTVGSGSVVWGSGITSSNGVSTMPSNSLADIVGFTYSGGAFVLASVGGAAVTASFAPNVITSLAASSEASTSLTFTWTAPTTDGSHSAASYYTVQYRVTGGSTWTSLGSNPSATTATITGLTASTSYDVEVAAVNTAGSSAYVTLTGTSTTAAPSYAPGVPTGLTAGSITASSIAWTWTAPATDGTHGAATAYTVETSPDNSIWSSPITVSSSTSYAESGLTAGTAYYLRVSASNTIGASAYSSSATGTTAAGSGTAPFNASGYLITAGVGGGTPTGTIAISAGTVAVNVNDNSVVTGSKTVPGSVYFAWSTSNAYAPTTGLQISSGAATFIPGANGENLWYLYANPPSTAGNYYLWALAYSGATSASTMVAAFVEANSVTFT